MSEHRSIFISVGDPSGDIAGAHLLEQLRNKLPDTEFFGLGGERMRTLGQRQLAPAKELSVMGFWEVAKKYFFFRNLMHRTVADIEISRPEIIIMVDYPGFNLRLAERIKHLGIPIVYYISPQIWAWHKKRIHTIKRLVDLMLLILPFEAEIYDKADVRNEFVGHYLMDDIPPDLISAPYNPESDLILLMPGSRPQEIQRMLPTLLDTATVLSKTGNYRFAVAGVDDFDYSPYLAKCSVKADCITGNTRGLIAESRLVLTSSGTATLETGIIGRPMIVIYKTGWLTYQIAKHLVKVDKIALINWVAGGKIVPELIQYQAAPEKIAAAAQVFLENKEESERIVSRLNETVASLGKPGTAERASASILEMIR